ncbi:MAG TPA: deoxyribodipyrimidine photo-lyase [Burkholderiales bacterium]|nr:deoxyribodipyrimidine photo-lyase [Burkholderiales bacterium]
MSRYTSSLCWFRRDLRSEDHAALHAALTASERVFCAFVFDTEILDKLPGRRDRRVEFIRESVAELQRALQALGGGLEIAHGPARSEIPRLAAELGVEAVFANHDYDPAAIARDKDVAAALASAGIAWLTRKDQVVFEGDEILSGAGRPYTVFTPYKNAWLKKLEPFFLKRYPIGKYRTRLAPARSRRMPSLRDIGFERTNLSDLDVPPGMSGAQRLFAGFRRRMDRYHERRDFPALKGPSCLSVHLRFGTVSVREAARAAWLARSPGAAAWLTELIWRDFYHMILFHFPHVVERSFRPELDGLDFPNDERLYKAWCEARTGYPLVDAAMRQINETGYMHNRLRMVTASFLVKDLLVDWRWGERYFAERLIDFDLAANNGGWQWAASTGCDAQPYFRIFNPVTQSEKFDPQGRFIRRYLPELARCDDRHIHAPWRMTPEEQQKAGVKIGHDYPAPIVDHAVQRKRALELYQRARRPA